MTGCVRGMPLSHSSYPYKGILGTQRTGIDLAHRDQWRQVYKGEGITYEEA
jgi:hypothetical protein